ncbi:hypothetical protein NM688_g524 [Phlebia brevispora]|uniref:Uncharacterized protein n=1 Tax=Phlebia brevispora TaxID=194682 RepID=A0ACC1TEA0_9APHY|nr:hypothetical protein NM688_g524 [Phlebia brevispora]
MPSVPSGTILLTGANGFIASWITRILLDQGYTVRCSVRSEAKGAALKKNFGKQADRIEIAIVPDIAKACAFDQAVQGVDAVIHTASPCHLNPDSDPSELIGPAVAGTTGLLQSALKYGTTVKRVVSTSSCATIFEFVPKPCVYTEENWNELSVKTVKEKGREAGADHKYCASKVLAERAVWDFVESHKGKLPFDVVTLCPPHVFGPSLVLEKDFSKLNVSQQMWLSAVKGPKDNEFLVTDGHEWADVRDVAMAHVLAIQKEAAANQRIIVAAGPWKWQDWLNIARTLDDKLPAGNTSYDPAKAVHFIRYNSTKSTDILGLKFRRMEDTTKDMVAQFREEGRL